jgi:hypothetical protein
LTPDHFWSLTPREFGIKYAAFQRAENRAKADQIALALMLGHYKAGDRQRMAHEENALRTYPIKLWTLPPGTTLEGLARARARRGLLRRGESDDAS